MNGDRVTFELTTGDWKFFYDLKNSGMQMSGKLVLKSANDSRSAADNYEKRTMTRALKWSRDYRLALPDKRGLR